MKEVIYINEEDKKEDKPVEFTHYFERDGICVAGCKPCAYDKVIYLGKYDHEFDAFCAFSQGTITIYKGHLNSGKY
jgi:hypothetical protein